MARVRSLAAVSGAFAMLLLVLPATAWAHENRDIVDNRYAVTIGFINEPAYVDRENGLYLRIVEYGGGGVEGLDQTLQAEVLIGPDRMPLTLLPLLNDPGTYESRFTPTRADDYTFQLTGQIGDAAIDEQFTSSPQGFDSVEPASADQFPAAVPAGEELLQRLDTLEGGVDDDDLAGVRTLAIVGIATGAAGLLAAGFAVFSRRRLGVSTIVAATPNPRPSSDDDDSDRLVRRST